MEFVKGKAYRFDDVYENCKYAVQPGDCNCNGGYICSHQKCSERCEENKSFGKCYSFSCPLVIDRASKEEIESDKDFDLSSISFDDEGLTEDFESIVIWNSDE